MTTSFKISCFRLFVQPAICFTGWQTICISSNHIVMLVNGCLKTFDVFYILDNKSRSTEMVATYMYISVFYSADFGYGSTLSVVMVIECLVAVGIIQKCLGSAKGDGSE